MAAGSGALQITKLHEFLTINYTQIKVIMILLGFRERSEVFYTQNSDMGTAEIVVGSV